MQFICEGFAFIGYIMDVMPMYSMRYFEENEIGNRKIITEILRKEIRLFEAIFDMQAKLFNGYFTVSALPEYWPTPTDRVILQSHIKSAYLLFYAHRLVLQGNFGVAQSLLRQIFEFALISKYFHVKKNDEEAEKWLGESQFDIFAKILKRLEKPSKKVLFDFWKLLCGRAHATVASCQITSDCKANIHEVANVYFVVMLLLYLDCISLDYLHDRKNFIRLKRYLGDKEVDELKLLRRERNELMGVVVARFSEEGKALIEDYKANWIFKTDRLRC